MKQPVAVTLRCCLAALVGISVLDASSQARTWRVTPDGTGDAPSLMAVMDSVSAGDTVLVAPGEFVITTVVVPDGIVVIGEEGPLQTRIVPFGFHVLSVFGCGDFVEISGLWFDGIRNGSGIGAVNVDSDTNVRISGCVFTNNEFGISMYSAWIEIESNTFVGNDWALKGFANGQCVRNIIWDPAEGLNGFLVLCNDILRLADVPELFRLANFSEDPQFCGPDNYHLMSTSPCAPGNAPVGDHCGLIGALPVNCVPTLVQERTWGQIKALYKH